MPAVPSLPLLPALHRGEWCSEHKTEGPRCSCVTLDEVQCPLSLCLCPLIHKVRIQAQCQGGCYGITMHQVHNAKGALVSLPVLMLLVESHTHEALGDGMLLPWRSSQTRGQVRCETEYSQRAGSEGAAVGGIKGHSPRDAIGSSS